MIRNLNELIKVSCFINDTVKDVICRVNVCDIDAESIPVILIMTSHSFVKSLS